MIRALTAVGDVNDVATWSGIPYFFLKAAQKVNFLQVGVSLKPERLRGRRMIWNARQALTTARWGGFQYSEEFLSELWKAGDAPDNAELISHFPLLPPARLESQAFVSYYIDATLKQNFEDYGVGRRVAPKLQQKILDRERAHYASARVVIGMSKWATRSIIDDYGIPAERVRAIRPGANLEVPEVLPALQERRFSASAPLRLGFVGKDWRRKGLLRLLDAADRIAAEGVAVKVVALGPSPKDLPPHRLLENAGFIDKYRDMTRFIELLQSFDFGCLLSDVEALGISTLECLALGVPVIGTRVGGIVDCIPDGLGLLVDHAAPAQELATYVINCVREPGRLTSLREAVRARRHEFGWDATLKKFCTLWEELENLPLPMPQSRSGRAP